MSKKISLVLEGGGMRGAYTAGCLSWFIDEGIEFDGAYGISTGALHLTSFLLRNKELLKTSSTEILPSKEAIGISSIIKEKQLVNYPLLFERANKVGLDISKIKTNTKAKIGLYDLTLGKTIYVPINELTKDLLIAACSLPLLGKVTHYKGHNYLDGGITKMIPIEESMEDGFDKHFIIATKPLDYVRKPANGFVVKLMKMVYKNCPNIGDDYKVRHLNYQKQISLIKELVNKGDAIYRYPTGEVKVTRLGGSKEDLIDLFNMGRNDMEASREEIYKFLTDEKNN